MSVRSFLAGLLLALSGDGAFADTLVLKDGRTLDAPLFRREGETIVAIAEVPGPDGRLQKVERAISLAEIAKVESSPPAVLSDSAPAFPAIVAAAKAAEPLCAISGSHWADLVILQAHTLIAQGRGAEAEALAAQLKARPDANVADGGQAISALASLIGGSNPAALSVVKDLLKARNSPDIKPSTIAAASVACGLALLEKEPRPALKYFLELPVFLPEERALNGIARLGVAKCYFAMSDYDRAIASLEELISTQPATAETAKAKTLLPEWQRRRTIVNESK